MVPLTVTFTDTSAAATTWNWSFGDGFYAETNPTTHTYTSGGTFTVRLEDENEWGRSDTTTIIHALTGANENADTAIEGFVVVNRFGGQFLVYNGTTLPGYSHPAPSVLISPPLTSYGWQNITFRSSDGIGFHNFGNETLMGNLSGVILQSTEKNPPGFSAATGSQSSISYILDLPAYPVGGTINTQIWEGALPLHLTEFRNISQGSGWSHVLDTSYTIKNTLNHFSPGGPAKLYVSVNSTWVANNEGRDHTFLVRIGDDGYGQVLPTRFLYNDTATNLDYFEADSPRGLSTFGLSQLQGSGNPFQLITLTVTSHVPQPATNENPSSDSDSDSTMAGGGGAGAGKVTVPVKTPTPTNTPTPMATVDPGKSAKIYTNANGVVSQATRLPSNDGRALVMVGEGVVAKDASGNPLPEITIQALASGSLPLVPSGSVFTFAGMAYEVGPEGATFSPPISLSFTVPQAQWGQDYVVKSFDRKSGTWQDLPTTLTATTGTVTAQSSHLCIFGLFAEPRAAPPAPAATPVPLPAATQVKAQPPATAVSIFASMTTWVAGLVMNNVVPLVAFIFLGIAG